MRAQNLAHHEETASGTPVSSRLFRLLSTTGQPDFTLLNVGVSLRKSSWTRVSLQVSRSIASISQVTRDGGSSRISGLRRKDQVVTSLRGGSATSTFPSTTRSSPLQ